MNKLAEDILNILSYDDKDEDIKLEEIKNTCLTELKDGIDIDQLFNRIRLVDQYINDYVYLPVKDSSEALKLLLIANTMMVQYVSKFYNNKPF